MSLTPQQSAAIDKFIAQCKQDPSPVPGRSNWDAIKVFGFYSPYPSKASASLPLYLPR
jgi:hypothetical protein